jgi:cytochrome c-type biogenesis protein CcmH/NrfF
MRPLAVRGTRAARAAVALGLLAALALAGPAMGATPRTTLPDVEDEVMCVVCGTPLNLAQAPQADRERVFIQRQIDRGLTKDEIKRRLEDQYGPSVLALPKDSGFDLAAYVVPVAAVGLALLALALTVPRWRRARAKRPEEGAGSEAGPAEPTPAEAQRLDEELARFEG